MLPDNQEVIQLSMNKWRTGLVASVALLVSLFAVNFLVDGKLLGGTPAAFGAENPAAGDQQNTDPVYESVQSWRDLVDTVNTREDQWYRDCLQSRVGVTWEQAEQYAQLNDQGHDLRFILIANSTVSDERARELLRERGVDNVDRLPIKRLPGFRNTRGLTNDRCNPFGDERSQVRVSLAIPVNADIKAADVKDGDSVPVHQDKGVLAMCSNPWDLAPAPPPPPPSNPPPTNPPPTGPPPTNPPPTTPPPTIPPCPVVDGVQTVREGDRCVKPERAHDTDGAGGDESNAAQPVAENPPPPVQGAPTTEPPPAERPQDHPQGGSGDGGAGEPTGPTDDSDADQETTVDNQADACESGNPADCN